MDLTGLTKLLVVVLVCVAAIFLGFYAKIDSQAVVALLGAALGYVFGNAHGIITSNQAINKIQETILGLKTPNPPAEP